MVEQGARIERGFASLDIDEKRHALGVTLGMLFCLSRLQDFFYIRNERLGVYNLGVVIIKAGAFAMCKAIWV